MKMKPNAATIPLDDVASLIGLHGFIDHNGDTIISFIFPQCGFGGNIGEHIGCPASTPRVGIPEHPNRWVGWHHCACKKCHVFKPTKNGWEIETKATPCKM